MSQGAVTNFIQPPPEAGPGMKFCTRCGEQKPEDKFDFKDKSIGRRDSVCSQCRSRADRLRYMTGDDSAYQRAMTEKFAQFVAQMNADHPDVPGISVIMSKMIAGLGGIDGFVAEWVKVLLSDKTSAIAKIRGFESLAKFCAQAGEQNKAVDGLRNMSTPDLQAFIAQMLGQELGKETLVNLAREQLASEGLKLLVIDEDSVVEAPVVPAPEPTAPVEGVA